MILISGLNKYYNKGKQNELHVLDNISVQFPERGMVALFGKSGCGKTTLLNVIGGLDKFDGGEILIDGASIRSDTDDIRNRYIGYIFQSYNLNADETCFENVANALRLCGVTDDVEIERRVGAALRNVGMEKFAKRSASALSGGQQQRIAIARAIVKNPRIILADEPTGNLDENNTLAVMDLLKEISQEHLVILVTHEAHLVDFYCDRVIELKDGKIESERENANACGYSVRSKNDIYLGELEKRETDGADAHVEYYGEAPKTPIGIKIVNNNGKLYVSVDSPNVQVLNDDSEIKLREGVFVQKERSETSESIDMSELPPITAGKTGRLFSLWSSIKSGYRINFGKQHKRGKKFLRRLLGVFAVVLVFACAVFGTAFGSLGRIDRSYDHNTFYVRANDYDLSVRLNAAAASGEGGIEFVSVNSSIKPVQNDYFVITAGFFNTFDGHYNSSIGSNVVYLDTSHIAGAVVAGRTDGLDKKDAVITTAVADNLLEASNYGFIKKYADLIGIETRIRSNIVRIAGIVRSDRLVLYADEYVVASAAISGVGSNIVRVTKCDRELENGSVIVVGRGGWYSGNVNYEIGKSILLHGKSFTVAEALDFEYYRDSPWDDEDPIPAEPPGGGVMDSAFYDNYLLAHGLKRLDSRDYTVERFKVDHPDVDIYSEDGAALFDEYFDAHFYEYLDYYFEYYKDAVELEGDFGNNFYAWLYRKKGIAEAYDYLTDVMGYANAKAYKAENGSYPALLPPEEQGNDLAARLKNYYDAYYTEMQQYLGGITPTNGRTFYVSDEDYLALSKSGGLTNIGAIDTWFGYGDEEDAIIGDGIWLTVHSKNVAATAAFLNGLTSEYASVAIVSPQDIHDSYMEDSGGTIAGNLITLLVTVALMSLCMYFIMRSALMTRIKEVGIYRAIGVSKKNMVFKFLVEAFVLTTLTVCVWFVIASIFVGVMCSSSLVAMILYYPAWLAIVLLLVIYAVCLLCGILPVLMLLVKSPGEILSKYDI